jgi:hypothetical protein
VKKAFVILKDGALIEVECVNADTVIFELNECSFVNFDKKTFACDTIARIEWID